MGLIDAFYRYHTDFRRYSGQKRSRRRLENRA